MTGPTQPARPAVAALSKLARSALGLLFPLSCSVCGSEGRYLCPGCEPKLPKLQEPYCQRCADPDEEGVCDWCRAQPPAFDGVRAPYLMEEAVRGMIHHFKYRNLRAAAPELGRLLADYLEANPIRADVLVPVPLHPRRERERGYNQAELLAREVGKRTGLPIDTQAVRRTRDTPPQVSMSGHDDRRRAVHEAFDCGSGLAGRRVMVIDDVVTSGSTMSACATALKAAGARSVWGLSVARQA